MKFQAKIIITVLSICNFPLYLLCQNFNFTTPASENELSSHSVYSLLRDRDGFLWIGTQNGLNKYDGEKFTTFLHNPNDTTSISDNFIVSLAEDSAGTLWIGTRHGLNFFDKKTERFTRIYLLDLTENSSHQVVRQIRCRVQGDVMVSTAGYYFFVSKTHPYVRYRSSNADSVFSFDIEKNGTLYLGRLGSLKIIFPDSTSRIISLPLHGSIDLIKKFGENLFLGTQHGLFILDKQYQVVRHILKGKNISVIEQDIFLRIWVGTENGLFIIQNNGSIIAISENQLSSNGLRSSNILAISLDRFGLLWLGMVRGGVQLYDLQKEQFENFLKKDFDNGTVWSFLRDSEGTEWLGTQYGLHQKKEGYKFSKIFSREIMNRMVGTIKEDQNGNIWFVARPNTLYRYSKKSQHLSMFRLEWFVHSEKTIAITDILFTKKGDLLVSTINGLFEFDQRSKKFISKTLFDKERVEQNYYFMHLFEDSQRRLWVSSSHGLYQYDRENQTYIKFVSNQTDSLSLSFNIVGSVMEDSEKNIWVSTFGGGINRFNEGEKNFTRFTTRHGLANDVVYGIVEDSRRNLWMSTDNGISMLNRNNEKWYSFGREEGLSFLEFSQNAFFKNNDGKISFGGIDGLVSFYPDKVQRAKPVGSIFLSDIRINYQSLGSNSAALVKGNLSHPAEIVLQPNQRTISFDFGLLDFRYRKSATFSYRLHKYDDEWIYPSRTQRTAHYTQLPSGTYIFEIRFSIDGINWNNTNQSVKIIVLPYFWETWWFITVGTLLTIGILVTAIRYVSQKKLKEQLREIEVKKKIHEERERISRELHDNTGAHLAGIISGLNIAEKHLKSSKQKTKKTLLSLTEDARSGMRLLRETIWALKSDAMTVAQFFEIAEEKIEKQLRYKKSIKSKFEILCSSEIILAPIQVLSIMRILQEALMNAIKHSTVKSFTIRLEQKNQSLHMFIHNDGKTTKKKKEELWNGEGLLNMERRAKEMGGTFDIRITSEDGTTITIIFPIAETI